jgi:hypothetical protein
MRRVAALGLIALSVAPAGCGSSGSHAGASSREVATTTDRASTQASLEHAVRVAVEQNFKLSLYVLWHNEVPTWAARSTRGPALAELRASAMTRRGRGIRIRPIKTSLRIQAISIDPSYVTATAVADSRQRVRPYESGSPQSRLISLHERARLTLKRVGSSQHFIVWKVAPIR